MDQQTDIRFNMQLSLPIIHLSFSLTLDTPVFVKKIIKKTFVEHTNISNADNIIQRANGIPETTLAHWTHRDSHLGHMWS